MSGFFFFLLQVCVLGASVLALKVVRAMLSENHGNVRSHRCAHADVHEKASSLILFPRSIELHVPLQSVGTLELLSVCCYLGDSCS